MLSQQPFFFLLGILLMWLQAPSEPYTSTMPFNSARVEPYKPLFQANSVACNWNWLLSLDYGVQHTVVCMHVMHLPLAGTSPS